MLLKLSHELFGSLLIHFFNWDFNKFCLLLMPTINPRFMQAELCGWAMGWALQFQKLKFKLVAGKFLIRILEKFDFNVEAADKWESVDVVWAIILQVFSRVFVYMEAINPERFICLTMTNHPLILSRSVPKPFFAFKENIWAANTARLSKQFMFMFVSSSHGLFLSSHISRSFLVIDRKLLRERERSVWFWLSTNAIRHYGNFINFLFGFRDWGMQWTNESDGLAARSESKIRSFVLKGS